MTHILVIFGTTDGHTRKVADRLGRMFRAYSDAVAVDIEQAGGAFVDAQCYDAVVVCASVHGGRYQRPVLRWVRANAASLKAKRTAFVSVCLGVLQKDAKVDRQLDAVAARFFTATGWQPTRVKKIAGALLYRKYGWIKRWVMRRIVAKAGGDIDTSRDYEYTDWVDLQAFADEFLSLVIPMRETPKVISFV